MCNWLLWELEIWGSRRESLGDGEVQMWHQRGISTQNHQPLSQNMLFKLMFSFITHFTCVRLYHLHFAISFWILSIYGNVEYVVHTLFIFIVIIKCKYEICKDQSMLHTLKIDFILLAVTADKVFAVSLIEIWNSNATIFRCACVVYAKQYSNNNNLLSMIFST